MVLDMARPKYKENTTWLGMRGRDAVRKSTPKVNILQVFTIDFSEIQFIVNHNSQSDGQNKRAKSGMHWRKKTIRTNSLQRKGENTKDNGILLTLVLHYAPASTKRTRTPTRGADTT